MSERARLAPRRSSLALPGSSERFLEKAPSIDADAFILDLEDAVAPEEKVSARAKIIAAVTSLDFGGRPVSVRVNGWTTRWSADDVRTIVAGCEGHLDAVMLPKTSGAAEIAALSLLIDETERSAGIALGTTGIDVLIESAIGLANVESAVAASPWVESLSIGMGDLAATLRMPGLVAGAPSPDYPGDIYHYALFRLLVAGRAVGITVLDAPYLRLGDLDGLREIAYRSRALGFDGKWAIHPNQVPILNGVYSPTPDEISRAEGLIANLDSAIVEEGRGAIRDADEMIDEATRKMAEAVLSRVVERPNGPAAR